MEPIWNRAMAVSLSIKNVPEAVARGLKRRAARNRRSLQGELLSILEGAAEESRPLTIEEVWRRVKRRRFATPAQSAAMIRADRDRGR
jgi:plasmid stability protein